MKRIFERGGRGKNEENLISNRFRTTAEVSGVKKQTRNYVFSFILFCFSHSGRDKKKERCT
jgi:hypothetical protein